MATPVSLSQTQQLANYLLDKSGNVDQTRFFILLGLTAASMFVVSRLVGSSSKQSQPIQPLVERAHLIPESILKNPNMESEHVRKVNVLPKNRGAKDYLGLEKEDKYDVLKGFRDVHDAFEKVSPAAGFKIRIVGSNAGTNPMEAEYSAFGHREIGSKMKMSEKDPFCNVVIKNDKKLEKFPELSDANFRVIETLQGNAQVISEFHVETWFELTTEQQYEMLERFGQLLQKFKKSPEDKLNYEIVLHNGIDGHQNVAHVHGHLLLGTSRVLALV